MRTLALALSAAWCFTLFAPGPAQAQPDAESVSVRILGPSEVAAGSLAELQIQAEHADSLIVRVRPRPDGLRERYTAEGTLCLLWIPAAKVTYETEATAWSVKNGAVKAVAAYHLLNKSDAPPEPPKPPNPPPGPGPEPEPEPDPKIPAGKFGITENVYRAAKAVNRPAESASLAAAFENTAEWTKKNEAGKLTMFAYLKRANSEAIPESSRPAWQPAGDLINARLQALYDEERLDSPEAWAACFKEIALGFRLAAE